ncbi:hypothetical protein OH77DRAFT_1518627 [Trametes cingulata]|nr:hypothetical protein OH77DRAFT_1518627 [Trametes cingulata]
MIFTTVFVTCVFALLGVFQQVSVDTLLSTLAHLRTPTLSSVTSFLHLTGSVTRFTLDAAPLAEVNSFLSSLLPSATPDEAFTNLDINVPDLPLDFNASRITANVSSTFHFDASGVAANVSTILDSSPEGPVPRPLWYHALNTVIRVVLLALAYKIFMAVWSLILELLADPSENSRSPVTGSLSLEHILSLDGPQVPDGTPAPLLQVLAPTNDDDGEHDESGDRDRPYDPLAFTYVPGSLDHYRLLCAPKPPYVPPSLSATSLPAISDTDVGLTRVFGVPRSPPLIKTGEEGEEDEDEDHDADAYLRAALRVIEDGAPPQGGWYLSDSDSDSDSGEQDKENEEDGKDKEKQERSHLRPTQDTLDAWVFPRQFVEDLREPEGAVVVVEGG